MSVKETEAARIRREMTAVLAQMSATLCAGGLDQTEAVEMAEYLYAECQKSIRENVEISEDRS